MMAFTSAALLVTVALPQPKDSSFWRHGDGWLAVGAVAATGIAVVFDERIARWTRTPAVQGDSRRNDLVKAVTVVNEMPLTVASIVTYGVGKLTRSATVADVGAHWTEALVATEVVSEVVRSGLGRKRPRASQDDAFVFGPGRGLTQFEYRSWPSLHAAVAFATAASLSEEMRLRNASARRVIAPLLYAGATIPGFTRLYLDQHWASDIVAGTIVGAFLGSRVVSYAHGRRTFVDRILLGAQVAPRAGGFDVGWTLER